MIISIAMVQDTDLDGIEDNVDFVRIKWFAIWCKNYYRFQLGIGSSTFGCWKIKDKLIKSLFASKLISYLI